MGWPVIQKPSEGRRKSNLADYDEARRRFSWSDARRMLDGLPEGRGLNIAHEAVDRHAAGPLAGKLALRWLGRGGEVRDYSYDDLRRQTSRFAQALTRLGVKPGDVVASLAGRVPELYIAALGTLKCGAVFSPLFSAFGPEPIRTRLEMARARVLVTTAPLYRRRVADLRAALPHLEHVLVVPGDSPEVPSGTRNLHTLLDEAEDHFVIPPTPAESMALLHFTSGTTGQPKGAMHVHEAVVAHHVTARFALDLHPDDRVLVHGRSRLGHGHVVRHHRAADGWASRASSTRPTSTPSAGTASCSEERITVWYTAPTAIRMLMKAGAALARRYRPLPPCASSPVSASRSTRKAWSGVWTRSTCPSTTTGGRPRRAAS